MKNCASAWPSIKKNAIGKQLADFTVKGFAEILTISNINGKKEKPKIEKPDHSICAVTKLKKIDRAGPSSEVNRTLRRKFGNQNDIRNVGKTKRSKFRSYVRRYIFCTGEFCSSGSRNLRISNPKTILVIFRRTALALLFAKTTLIQDYQPFRIWFIFLQSELRQDGAFFITDKKLVMHIFPKARVAIVSHSGHSI